MRSNYTRTTYFSPAILAIVLMVSSCISAQFANAQTFYKVVSSAQLDLTAAPNIVEEVAVNKIIESESAYLIKDGQLDEIYKLKLTLPNSFLNNVLKDKKVVFEQTHVMILPIMGMVHFVGTLDVDGVKSITSFQLGFKVNDDQSVTFSGTKLLKLGDLFENLPKDELKLAIDFVLRK